MSPDRIRAVHRAEVDPKTVAQALIALAIEHRLEPGRTRRRRAELSAPSVPSGDAGSAEGVADGIGVDAEVLADLGQ